MIEEIIRNYLLQGWDVPVHTVKPDHPPTRYIMIEKVGGGRENHISTARIAVQSYGSSLYEAAALNEEVKKKMEGIIVLDEISRSELNSDYNFPDTSKKQNRYQAIYDLVYFDFWEEKTWMQRM